MDSARFDSLAKALASRRPRRTALSLLAVLGLGLAREEADAKKKNEKKVKVCQCFSEEVTSCSTKKKTKDKAKKLLKNFPCSYKGSCRGVSGCTAGTVPPPPSGGSSPPPPPPSGPTCSDGIKNGTETDVDCGGGACPRCAIGKTCTNRNDCASARCAGGTCQPCTTAITDCGTDTGGGMCACRDHESGSKFCTKQDALPGRVFPAGTTCSVCQGGEQCFPINGGAGGIECVLPCGA